MKLLSAQLSPFAARCRVAIYAGDLPVEIAPSNMWGPDGQKSPDYLALNPIGKVPALILDDGSCLPESETIVDYLADKFPAVGLHPEGPELQAKARLLARITELYVATPGIGMFMQLFAPERDQAVIDNACAEMSKGLGHLDHFLPEGGSYAVGDRLSTADCAMIPYLYFFPVLFGRHMGKGDLIAPHRKVAAYWTRIQKDPIGAKVIEEITTGLAESRLKMLLDVPA